ncbi:TetR/AcrR family transcriptional regulator [Henriciella sp. AS95]|uniref:TetR/AcrR family transcriptional regulator n=1 Tax=Henriciella sp. AS95 TaxID=3135782 RepID=UPI003180F1D0
MKILRARSEEAKDDRRQALLEAALDEFFEKGFAASRMADIAKRAHLSKGTLYLYFDSKEDLFKALVETLAAPNIDQIESIAETSHSLEQALAGMRALAPHIIRDTDLPRLIKVLIGDSHMFPTIVQAYRTQLIERVFSIIAGILERAHAAGEIEVENAPLTARIVIAPIVLSALWQALFGRDPTAHVDLDKLFEIHTRLLLKALRPDPAS